MTCYKNGQLKKGIGPKRVYQREKKINNVEVKFESNVLGVIEERADCGLSTLPLFQKLLTCSQRN